MRKNPQTTVNRRITDMVKISLCTVFIVVCSWIALPSAVPVTMQTFGVFFVLQILGGRKGTVSIVVYLMLGLAGLPVFSNFQAGVGVLFGATGGFIVGFIAVSLIYWATVDLISDSPTAKFVSLALGDIVCLMLGTLWYAEVSGGVSLAAFAASFAVCVLPCLIPEAVKLVLSFIIAKKCFFIIRS